MRDGSGAKPGKATIIYDGSLKTGINPAAQSIVENERKAHGVTTRRFTSDEIIARCITAMIAKGVRVLEDSISLRPVDIDAVELFGYGFPRHRGGPMHMADKIGSAILIDRIETRAFAARKMVKARLPC